MNSPVMKTPVELSLPMMENPPIAMMMKMDAPIAMAATSQPQSA